MQLGVKTKNKRSGSRSTEDQKLALVLKDNFRAPKTIL